MNWKKLLPLTLVALAILASILLVSCDDREGKPLSYYIARMQVAPDTIYADNNITYATVWVYVKDNNGFPVPGERVSFKSSLGTIEAYKDTDSSGVAEAWFWDSNQTGEAEIFAIVGDDSRKEYVTIVDAPAIESLNLTIGSSTLLVNNVTQASATVITELHEPIEDGSQVVFECTRGYFVDQSMGDLGTRMMATTTNGIAKVTYNSGTEKGNGALTASIGDKVQTRAVTVNPGKGVYMDLDVPTEPVNVGQDVSVVATVLDRYNNTVKAQTTVNFEADLGDIPASAATDTSGTATVTFSSGVEAGLSNITATADSAQATAAITIASDEVATIEFPHSSQINISVLGTGGAQSAPLQVHLLDMSGNMITEDQTVWFAFSEEPPTGCNINGSVTAVGDSVAVVAHNGLAVASINSGPGSGPVSVMAYTWNDTLLISSQKTNIVVQAGPPDDIELFIGEYDTGTAYGSGAWRVGLSARVEDNHGNAVNYGTAVYFELVDTSTDSVTVNSSGYTGNISVDGDSLQGVAFSYIIYDGDHSNEIIPIRARAGGVSVVSALKLPMNQPTLDCNPEPGHLDWVNGNGADLTGEVYCVVTDSQGNPIHDAVIQCYSTRGEFINPDPQYQTSMGPAFIKTDYNGTSVARVRFHQYECPPVVPPPNEVPVDLTFILYGTEVTDTATITLLNYNP